jgi:excisionase family DNA binding protein
MCDWLTATEAAAYLKVKPRTILQWAKEGRLKGYRLSGTARVTWRFLRSDLDAKMLPPSAAITEEYAAKK